jgi:hypothetical protein
MTARGVFDDSVIQPAALLPFSQYQTTALASGVIPAALITGCMENVLVSSGATALTLPSAAQLYAALSMPGLQYRLRIINTNAGTLTVTAGTGITVTGSLTLATNTWREFDVTLNGANAATFKSVGTGTYS